MPNYNVVLQAGWIVKKAKSVEDAINIAIAEAGKKLNPDLSFVRVDVGSIECPKCGEAFKSALLISKTALVGLVFEMKVFNAESEEHAIRIARAEIGKRMPNIPLEVIEAVQVE
ncbi:MAG: DUF555 domain-containing protein [Archaeoglobaceae archaeon]|nr:DUF555 domain-containing protein [Archaeoglobaceae archaeon]MDW8128749.1 DUF555 domain-containing protein [Archaeoglobaceae archaeon]